MSTKLSKTFVKPLVVGSIAALGMHFAYGSSSIEVMGVNVNSDILIFATSAGANYVGEIGGNYILDKIPGNSSMADTEKRLATPLVAAAANAALLWGLGVTEDSTDLLKAAALGAGATLIGDQVYDRALEGLFDETNHSRHLLF